MHPWVGLSDHVRLGTVARWVTPELVAEALDDCGVRDKKPGALPAGFMVYFTLALTLLAWLRLLALDGDLAKAGPKTLSYRILHAAARLTRSSRRRQLKIPATWPWADAIATAWARITALPQAP